MWFAFLSTKTGLGSAVMAGQADPHRDGDGAVRWSPWFWTNPAAGLEGTRPSLPHPSQRQSGWVLWPPTYNSRPSFGGVVPSFFSDGDFAGMKKDVRVSTGIVSVLFA